MKKFNRILAILIIIASVISLPLIAFGVLTSNSGNKGMLILMGVASLFLVFSPMLVEKIFKIKLPAFLSTFLYSFVILAMLMGAIFNLYAIIPIWDKILHLTSGALFVVLGMVLLNELEKTGIIKIKSKLLAVLLSFVFAIAMGAVWEFMEFFIDAVTGSNSQRFLDASGQPICGRPAIYDTMFDMIYALVGSVITCFVYIIIYSKKKKNQKVEVELINDSSIENNHLD